MDVGVCGFGFSGSGAVLDLLKEYPEVYVADKTELSFIYKPDGILDLYHNICLSPSRYFSSDSAIRRFIQYMERSRLMYNRLTNGSFDSLWKTFIHDVIDVEWKGSTSVHRYQDKGFSFLFIQKYARAFRVRLEKKYGPFKGHCYPEIEMYYSAIREEDFLSIARSFVLEMMTAMQGSNKAKVRAIDQAFAANNPRASFPFFDNPKAIVVLRDPRDIYLLAKCSLGLSGRFIPTDSVDDFITYYTGLLENSKFDKRDKDILTIYFEELVYDTANATKKIEVFLGISEKNSEKKFFKPEISINNTQLMLRYPSFSADIKKIEDKMGKYLYPFNEFEDKPIFNIKSF